MDESMKYDTVMARRARKLSDQIRLAIDASGMSRYAICKALDLDQSTMSRFMAGSGIELASIALRTCWG
jgi:predicted XRE-type DNA-binding protein